MYKSPLVWHCSGDSSAFCMHIKYTHIIYLSVLSYRIHFSCANRLQSTLIFYSSVIAKRFIFASNLQRLYIHEYHIIIAY